MNANYFTMAKREFCTKQETKTCHKGSWVRWSDFSSETDGQKAVDFKEKTYLLIKNSISCKTVLNSEGETKTFLDKEKLKSSLPLSSLQLLSWVLLLATPWAAPCQASLPHQLLELAQTHVHWVGDAIQPSHPLSSPSPPAFNLSQNQGLFQWVSSSHQVAKVLEFQLQHQSFQWIFRVDFL